MSILTDYEGEELVKLARSTVESYISKNEFDCSLIDLSIKAGAFVSLFSCSIRGQLELRGCIGFPYADKDLCSTIKEAAIAAAIHDPRFKSITMSELSSVIFEVSVLTNPSEINVNRPDEYLNNIMIGTDGLILKWEYGSGLFLPQVPLEYEWSVEEYLTNLCYKAGAPPEIWRVARTRLYKFQAIIFREIHPNGSIVKVSLAE
jgi:uncharacterized protein